MIVINSAACSESFNAALLALNEGVNVRQESWPAGQYLSMDKRRNCIVVHRPGKEIPVPWLGPSSAESDAQDWVTAPAQSTQPSSQEAACSTRPKM
jgi:hypothetical protein